jgi:hypothetical protein
MGSKKQRTMKSKQNGIKKRYKILTKWDSNKIRSKKQQKFLAKWIKKSNIQQNGINKTIPTIP